MALRTSCSHCGTQFKVPDKTLGKQARCKSCGKMFVIAPVGVEEQGPLEEVKPPSQHGSTAQMQAVAQEEAVSDDPLDALAGAAIESGSHMRPVHRSAHPHTSHQGQPAHPQGQPGPEQGFVPRHRKAKGATFSMSLGIAGVCLALLGCLFGLITMLVSGNENFLVTFGLITIGLEIIAGAMGMMALVNASSASRSIRRARHPLGGRGHATTGTITGWITVGLILITVLIGAIWISVRGGIVFEKQVDQFGNPIQETQ